MMMSVLAWITLLLHASVGGSRMTPTIPLRYDAWEETHSSAPAVTPIFKQATLMGPVIDPQLQRDSCGSSRMGNRSLWVCRDTGIFNSSDDLVEFFTSSASWTDFAEDGSPAFQAVPNNTGPGPYYPEPNGYFPVPGYSQELIQYGQNDNLSFYPFTSDECHDNQGGSCPDGSRWALWPDSPPLVVHTADNGVITAYTWVLEQHLTGLTLLDPNPPTTLYRVTYTPGSDCNALPSVEIVEAEFWPSGTFPWGDYGNYVLEGYAYLYGQSSTNHNISLARVPVGSVEDKTCYEFWVNGSWSSTMPQSVNDTGAAIDCPADGQGTFYYSEAWKNVVWIGEYEYSAHSFWITTAVNPQGPWLPIQNMFMFPPGNASIAGYSQIAHPGLSSDPNSSDIYVSYTRQDMVGTLGIYTNVLYLVAFSN